MSAGAEAPVVRAAGAVAWRPGPDGPLMALVHRGRYDDWSFPKGKREPGEHLLLTAVREVAEEARTQVVLGRPLGVSVYTVNGRQKQVDFWAGRADGPPSAGPGDDVDAVDWLAVHAVRQRLSHDREIRLLDEFLAAPVRTVPLILVRHASAGQKLPDPAADRDRPLDAAGAAAARELARLLACFGRCNVFSSATERCLATVRPYAAAVGTQVRAEEAFTIVAGHRPSDEAAARRAAAIAAAGQPAVICAHREDLPVLLATVCGSLGAPPPEGAQLPKGSFWVLHRADGSLISAEQHVPEADPVCA
jgi:8-oxo-(d)GTP phosphatase